MAESPAVQLVGLCTGYGAVPPRIRKVAPFLCDLPSTQRALQVLYPNGEGAWQHAARELLICVTKPGGAAGFNERSSRFVRACLGLNGALQSYTQRMSDLTNDPDFNFWKSRNTLDKQRDVAMDILASRILLLKTYPCDPGPVESALEEFIDLAKVVKERHLQFLDDDELRVFYNEAFRRLTSATAFFEHYAPRLSLARRFRFIIAAVAAWPYRQIYVDLMPRSGRLLIRPEEVVNAIYEERYSFFTPDSPEMERTMQLIERIILDIEDRDGWGSLFLATVNSERQSNLTNSQVLQLRAYFERLVDDS